mmetsp:Transcript_58066/g.67040  ORF Transcript_58066/g.67040 Transcript_58066/m.67040 type:complete len:216 (-) Transcript_58066:144-791(-)
MYAFPLSSTKTTARSSHIHFMMVAVVVCFMIVAMISKPVLVEAAVAHTAMTTAKSIRSASSSSLSSLTMMAITAGSRTLIEIGGGGVNDDDICHQGNKKIENQQKDQYQIDVSYLDDDYENGLLILRRVDVANNTIDTAIDIDIDNPQNRSVLYKFSATFKKMKMKRNPLVTSSTCILLGNVASMIGIIPIGLSGFVPALSMMATVGIIKSKKQK